MELMLQILRQTCTNLSLLLDMIPWTELPWWLSGIKNLPAKAGDPDLTPNLERSHMLHNNETHGSQLLNLCSRAQEPQLLKPAHPKAYTPQQGEATTMGSLLTATRI